jgi:hypothetical protein
VIHAVQAARALWKPMHSDLQRLDGLRAHGGIL